MLATRQPSNASRRCKTWSRGKSSAKPVCVSATHATAIGLLLEVGQQPRPDWDEAEDGPNLGERYWLIRTLDGRDFRWTNAMFVVVPEPAVHPRYEVRSIYDQLRTLWAQKVEVPDNPARTH